MLRKRSYISRFLIVLLTTFVLIVALETTAMATTYYTYTNGNPAATASWWTGTTGTGTHPANFTTAGDVFIIQNNNTMTATAAWTVGSATATTTTSTIQISSGCTLAMSTYLLTLASCNLTNAGTYSGSGGVTISGTGTTISIGGFTTTGTTTMTKTAGTATFTGNVSGAALTINGTGGTLNLGAGLTHTFTGAVTLTNGTLNGGSSTINENATSVTAWGGTGANFTAGTSTVVLGGAAQTISASATSTFYNLTLAGSGAKTFTNAVTINDTLMMSGTATVTYTTTPTMAASSTLEYNKTAAFTAGAEWQATLAGNLLIAGSGTITSPNATRTVSGTLTVNSGASLTVQRNLTVTGATNISGTVNWSSNNGTARTMTLTGDVTLNSGSSWVEVSATANDVFGFGGNFTNNATTFTGTSTGTHTFSGTGKTISGSTITSIPNVAITGTITENGTLTVTTGLSGAGTLTVGASGTLNIQGTCSVTTLTNNGIVTSSGTGTTTSTTVTNNLTFNMGSTGTVTAFTNAAAGVLNVTATPTVATITTLTVSAVGNTVNYTGAGAQTVRTGTTFYNLGLSGSGAKTMTGVTAITNNFSMSGSATATPVLTSIGGAVAILGTAVMTTGANLAITGSLTVGDGTNAAGFTAGAFTLSVGTTTTVNNASTITFNSATNPGKTFIGLVTINSGATWTESAAITPTFQGGITNSGTFTASTGVHTFSTNAQALTGTFTILSVTVTTIVLSNNGTLTCATALAGTGTFHNISTGTLNYGGTCWVATLTNDGIVTSSGTGTTTSTTVTNNLTFNMGSTGTVTAFTNAAAGVLNVTATPTVATITTLTVSAVGNTVNYTGAGAQTVRTGTTFYNLGLSGSGAKTMTGVTAITNNFSMSGSATATPVLTSIGGAVAILGTAVMTAGANNVVTGSLTVGAGATLSMGGYSLSIGGTSSITGTVNTVTAATGTKTFTGAVTINSGGVWDLSGQNPATSFGGGITMSGTTFNNGTGAAAFSANQSLLGANNMTFGGTVTPAGSTTLINSNTGTVTISSIVLTGNFTQGTNALLSLTSATPFSSVGTFDASTNTNTVNYTGAAQAVKATTYINLTLSGSGNKTFSASTTINGTLSISGSAVASLVAGTSSPANGLILGGTTETTPGTYGYGAPATYTNTTYFANSTGVIALSMPGYWTGTTSSNWDVGANWWGGSKPDATVDAFIPSGGTQPIISASDGLCKNITINGSLTISGSNNLAVSGNWTNNGGTFTPGSGTVTFNGSATQYINGSATQTFNNVVISGAGGLTVGGTTTTLNVGGSFTETTGNFTAPATMTVTGAVTLTAGTYTAGTNLSVGGNWTNNGGTFTPGSGTVTFNGSATQNVNGSATTQTFNNIVINNTSGVTLGGSSAFNISGSMTISNGTSLELSAGPSLTIGSSASATTTGAGKIILDTSASYINLSSSSPMLQVQTRITGSKGWRMLAAPDSVTVDSMFASPFVTQGFTGSTIDTLQPNLLWWDETSQGTSLQAWRQPSANSDMVKLGRGYMFYVFDGAGIVNSSSNYSDTLPLTMSASGSELPLTTAFDFGVTATMRSPGLPDTTQPYVDTSYADYGWNLVGNPTPSTIDWNASSGWTKTNMDASIYIWDPNDTSGGYKTWNGTTGNLGSGLIAPFQAFWVKADANSPSLQCTNGVKTTGGSFLENVAKGPGGGGFVKKMADDSPGGGSAKKMAKASTSSAPVLSLNLSANGLQTQAYLMFSGQGKLSYDPYDAFSLVPLSTNYLILYTVAGQGQPAMQIQDLPDTGFSQPFTLPLYVGGTVGGQPLNGSFTLGWKLNGRLPAGWNVTLMDDAAQKADSMSGTGELTFQYNTPAELVPSNGTLLEKNSATASNHRPLPALPWPVVQTVPTSKLSKTASVTPRFRLVISANNSLGYLPSTPKLQQNYPNPFNPSTNLAFSVPAPSRVTIEVFNVLGQKIATVADKDYATGKYVVTWNPRQAASGVYFCRMIVGNHKQTIKMVLLR